MTDRPSQTAETLRRDLTGIGLAPGLTVMVHASLSRVGRVRGGAGTVVEALTDVLEDSGTLAMPAASPACHDPSEWIPPIAPGPELDELRVTMPAFDRGTTPTAMGAIAETFRTLPGTLRSAHPTSSVCARGPLAETITRHHALEFSEGAGTPFEVLYEIASHVLLLGVGFNRCTALHFAESRSTRRRTIRRRSLMMRDRERTWIDMPEMDDDNDTHFPRVGAQFVAAGHAYEGNIGEASSIFCPVRDLVHFATDYFDREL